MARTLLSALSLLTALFVTGCEARLQVKSGETSEVSAGEADPAPTKAYGYREGYLRSVYYDVGYPNQRRLDVAFDHTDGFRDMRWEPRVKNEAIIESLAGMRSDELYRFHYEIGDWAQEYITKLERLDDILPLGRERTVKAIEGRNN